MNHKQIMTFTALILIHAAPTLSAEEEEHEQQAPHVHGEANLLVALDDTSLEIELHSPAINIVGFEHEAQNDAQAHSIELAVNQLRQVDQLFTLPASARCSTSSIDIHFPFSDQDPDAHQKVDNEAEDHDEEGHKDIEAHYHFICENAGQLNQITVNLFTLFPGTNDIEVQSISPQGQQKQELTPKHNIINL